MSALPCSRNIGYLKLSIFCMLLWSSLTTREGHEPSSYLTMALRDSKGLIKARTPMILLEAKSTAFYMAKYYCRSPY